VVVAGADQELQLAGRGRHGLQAAQTVAIGAQVVGQLGAVARVGLGLGRAPTWAGGVEGIRVNRDDGVPGRQQPIDHQTVSPFDRHRQVSGCAVAGQPLEGGAQVRFGVGTAPAVDDAAVCVQHRDGVALGGPVPADVQHGLVALPPDVVDSEGLLRRVLIVRPWPLVEVGHVPEGGPGAPARRRRRYSCWPLRGKPRRPSPDGDRVQQPSLRQATTPRVHQ
jgi:hypothetical protein